MIATAVCNTYIELGVTAYTQGYRDVADRMLGAALEEAQRLSNKKSPPCAVFNRLALLYYQQQNYDQAENVYEQALVLYERIFEETDPILAGIMLNLAELYFSRKKYDRAEPLYKRALRCNHNTTDVDSNPLVERCLLKLAWIYCNQQRHDEAHKLYKRARAIRDTKTGNAAVVKV